MKGGYSGGVRFPIAVAGSMPTSYRMHYQVAACYFCHNLDGLWQGPVVHEMIHGIQMEAHSNTTAATRYHSCPAVSNKV